MKERARFMENALQQRIKDNEKIIGTLGVIIAVIMFTSIIEAFFLNLKGQSNIYIQPMATALNGFLWSLYAYGKKDWFLLGPNMLALILGIATTISAFV